MEEDSNLISICSAKPPTSQYLSSLRSLTDMPNSEPNDEECDAIEDDSSNAVGPIILLRKSFGG